MPQTMTELNHLPDELTLSILSHLPLKILATLQQVNRRFLSLARDDRIWRTACFERSWAHRELENHQDITAQSKDIEELFSRFARQWGNNQASHVGTQGDVASAAVATGSSTAADVRTEARTGLDGSKLPDETARRQTPTKASLRQRAMTDWDPRYRDERIRFYQEYRRRHTPISHVSFLESESTSKGSQILLPRTEMLGMDVVQVASDAGPHAVVAPLDDGSVCMWDISICANGQRSGRLLGRSKPGLLPEARMSVAMAPVQCVSVHQPSTTAFVAAGNGLVRVDLGTMQVISAEDYPSRITALATGSDPCAPLTIGTTSALHLHDSRTPHHNSTLSEDNQNSHVYTRLEPQTLIPDRPSGPVSILHLDGPGQDPHSIWAAGRWKALMVYDRRQFPRLQSTRFTGAQIASLAAMPHLPKDSSRSLLKNPNLSMAEFEDRKNQPGAAILAAGEYRGKGSLELYGVQWDETDLHIVNEYHNRQTVSASPALAVSPHGASVVVSDGNGNLKWFERDIAHPIRTFDLNRGINTSRHPSEKATGDTIVRKILQTRPDLVDGQFLDSQTERDDLLLLTGQGDICVLGFGSNDPLASSAKPDAAAESTAQDDERIRYERAMDEFLRSQGTEARFLANLAWTGS